MQVMKLLTQGNHRRTQEATAANATSSRSHAILHLELVSSPKRKDGLPSASQVFRVRILLAKLRLSYRRLVTWCAWQRSSFFMCDLAGSERAAQTQNKGTQQYVATRVYQLTAPAAGIRMVEGQHINRSLLALGNCINALSAPGGRDK